MIKISNFCGIFATLFVTTTMVLLASCSQDDDYYDSDMYTLAEMGTRLGGKGDPGNGTGGDLYYEAKVTKSITFIDTVIYESVSALVTLKIKYNPDGSGSTIEYISCSDSLLKNLRIRNPNVGSTMYQNHLVIICSSAIDGTRVIHHDSLPDDSFAVTGQYKARYNPNLFTEVYY
ncbi:MAG: hypothetical protein Q4D25_11295 [Bacteroidales bacterium]|nr:hypothetical protein [Bacteroidales bacterium]